MFLLHCDLSLVSCSLTKLGFFLPKLNTELTKICLKVWGCAGIKAETDQKHQQNWEKRQAEQLQKVNRLHDVIFLPNFNTFNSSCLLYK